MISVSYSSKVAFALLVVLATHELERGQTQEPRLIFDWELRYGFKLDAKPNDWPRLTNPVSHLGYWKSVKGDDGKTQQLLHQYDIKNLSDSGKYRSVMIRNQFRPVPCESPKVRYPEKMDRVLSQVAITPFLKLDFVFADIETGDATCDNVNYASLVDSVRKFKTKPMSAIKVGGYGKYPGRVDPSILWGKEDRTVESDFYLKSGLKIAMPNCYPYSYYIAHKQDKTSPTPSDRAALFWAPIAKLTTASQALPSDHLLVPYVSVFVAWGGSKTNYVASPPTRSDLIALIKHMRLRGADGYFCFAIWNTSFSPQWFKDRDSWIKTYSKPQYRRDIWNAWTSLDEFFGGQQRGKGEGQTATSIYSPSEIASPMSVKKSGVIMSGARRGNQITIMVSNLGNQKMATADYPRRYGLPDQSPPVPCPPDLAEGQLEQTTATAPHAKCHQQFSYTIKNLVSNANFDRGTSGWLCHRGAQWSKAMGAENSPGIWMPDGAALEVAAKNDCTESVGVDADPLTRMQILVTAKGNNAKLRGSIGYVPMNQPDSKRLFLPVTWATGEDLAVDGGFKTYRGTFTTHESCGPLIHPKLQCLTSDRNSSESTELIIDRVAVRFDDYEDDE